MTMKNMLNLLVIDDSEDDRLLCRRVLKEVLHDRLSLAEESSGEHALDAIEKADTHCVLLDYSLPGHNGIEVLKRIRNRHPYLPVILLTGQGNEAVAVQAIKEGAQDYLTKGSITPDTLSRAVRTAVENGELRKRIDEQHVALLEREERLNHAQRLAHIGSFIKNLVTGEVSWSDETYRIFGTSRETYDPSIANILLMVHPDDRAKVLEIQDQIKLGVPVGPIEFRIIRPDSVVRHIYLENELIHDDAAELRYAAGTIQDVTERERQRRDVERSNEDLANFAYIASHDLKAPLRAIDHLSEWIAEDIKATASDDTLENLSLLRGRVNRLHDLVEGLLAYSRVGRAHHETEPVDTRAMIAEIVDSLDLPAFFAVDCVGDMPVLETRAVPLRRVLQNLISNGIRHHDRVEGRIRISAKKANHSWEFRVADDGPGIPPQFHSRIFEIFQTLQTRDDLDSSGVGLAIVKKTVEDHGGHVWVESKPPERGSCFGFRWNELAA
jgi:PAS domain S-box-containing protein